MPIDPPPSRWQLREPTPLDDDVIGAGADLEPGTVLDAYRIGLFPMRMRPRDRAMTWWSPVDRGVLPLDGLRVSRSLRQSCHRFDIRVDAAFAEVLARCADPRRTGSWIDEEIVSTYTELHRLGWVHSVEAWRDGELAGGLYGVAIGGLFAGESMFTRPDHWARDASKAALVGLVELLRDGHADRRLLDTQWQTDHLATLGVVEIPREDYLRRLADALEVPLPEVWR